MVINHFNFNVHTPYELRNIHALNKLNVRGNAPGKDGCCVGSYETEVQPPIKV